MKINQWAVKVACKLYFLNIFSEASGSLDGDLKTDIYRMQSLWLDTCMRTQAQVSEFCLLAAALGPDFQTGFAIGSGKCKTGAYSAF